VRRTSGRWIPKKQLLRLARRARNTWLSCLKDGNFSESVFCVIASDAGVPLLSIKQIYSRFDFNSLSKLRVKIDQTNAIS
jgi:hypothetical protein